MKIMFYLHFLLTLFVLVGCGASQLPVITEQESNIQETPSTPVVPKRPTGAVFLQSNLCACKAGKVISLGNCTSICAANASVTAETLFLEVKVGPEIEATDLKDVYGWCKQDIIDPETGEAVENGANPSCSLQAKDEFGRSRNLDGVVVSSGSNIIKIDVTGLDYDMTYRINLIEIKSSAVSDIVQFRKISDLPEPDTLGPLWPMPVTQYTCMNITTSSDSNTGTVYYDNASRVFFYFVPEVRRDPLQAGIINFYCHAIDLYGKTDTGKERLEETPGAFTLWSRWDPRFYDLNNNNEIDVHDTILNKVKAAGVNLTAAPKLFYEFKWMSAPNVSASDSSSTQNSATMTSLGYYMTPWVDSTTLKSYCPNQTHYYSSNQLFVAMRDLVAVDTEGLYIAKKEGNSCTFMLVREGVLNQIWFYMSNGFPIVPNSDTIRGQKVQFHWPPDFSTPLVKKGHQQTYTVFSAEELAALTSCSASSSNTTTSAGSNSSGVRTTYPTHDKRIGCVPVGE